MMEKIEWYQEVLELEPSSKVFFPLAKLLQNNKRPSEAISTLRQGLERHPEFFEARLMLIDLLENNGQSEVALYEVDRLGSKLGIYPGFWKAWAGVCEKQGQLEVSVALRLMATFLSGRDITLIDVFQYGLKSVLDGKFTSSAPEITLTPTSGEQASPTKEPFDIYIKESDSESIPGAATTLDVDKIVDKKVTKPLVVDTFISEGDDVSDSDTDEEPFSLRTKTMATLLMEQGDLHGAMEIYEELLEVEDSPGKKLELQGRITELKAKMKIGETEPVMHEAKTTEPLQAKQKLLDALENLAKRLEVRADD